MSDVTDGDEPPTSDLMTQPPVSQKRLTRAKSRHIVSRSAAKKSKNMEGSDDILNGAESLFAAFAQNTVRIHDEFKEFALKETRNTSKLVEIQNPVNPLFHYVPPEEHRLWGFI